MNDMKNKFLGFRVDEKTFELLKEASSVSGIPCSEIIRKGILPEVLKTLSMFNSKTSGDTKLSIKNKN